jgi:hypothetical protein
MRELAREKKKDEQKDPTENIVAKKFDPSNPKCRTLSKDRS